MFMLKTIGASLSVADVMTSVKTIHVQPITKYKRVNKRAWCLAPFESAKELGRKRLKEDFLFVVSPFVDFDVI